MRSDMHKVIVERERLGSRGPYRGSRRKQASLAELPSKEGIRRRHLLHRDVKQLNENLGPLRKYLRKQVGRSWNAVYRDISAELRATSAVKQHVRDHLWDYVERHVTLGPKGEVFGPPHHHRSSFPRLLPGKLFVHPRSGVLKVVKPWR